MYGRIGVFLLVTLWGFTAFVFAQSLDGRIVDVFGKNVTVRMDAPGPLKAGDKVDLSYVAETMEFLIGQYQVVQVKENVFIAKELASSMPPSKEMKVRIVKSAVIGFGPSAEPTASQGAAAAVYQEINTSAMDPKERDPRFLGANNPYDIRVQPEPGRPASPPPAGINKTAPSNASKRPVTVEVLGPNEGVEPSAPPNGQAAGEILGSGQGQAPRTGYPTGQPSDRSGVPLPSGQGAKGEPFENFFGKDSSQWKEITFKEYKQQLINEAKFNAQYSTARPTPPATKPRLGVAIKTNDSPIGQAYAAGPMGVRVTGVTPGTPAEKNDIQVADIIYEVDNIKVSSADMFVKYIFSVANKVQLKIQRDGQLLEKTVTLPGK